MKVGKVESFGEPWNDNKIKDLTFNKLCKCDKYKKALEDILAHSTAPFVRIDMSENMKWLNYVHEVAKEVLNGKNL